MLAQSDSQLHFGFLPDLSLVVQRQQAQISCDAGLLPIRQFDQRRHYTARMTACLSDARREPSHGLDEMLRQRLYGILAEYEDCNDHATLRDDPIFKIVVGRKPEDDPLASQPTLSRFENAVSIPALYGLLDFLCKTGVERLKEKNDGHLPAEITLDIDATDDTTHGAQQLTFFHGYYDQYQYFPLVISEPTTRHIFHPWLRPGNVHAAHAADEDVLQVAGHLRAARPDVAIHVRGDSGFGVPWMYEVCEQNNLSYTFGIAGNPRLKAAAQDLTMLAEAEFERTGQKQRLFTCFSYRADSWDRSRSVIAKVEHQAAGSNLRFVVTSLPVESDAQAERRYDDYVQRGTSEQRMDELKNGLHADRLSCHRFVANFWRWLLHAAALNLLNWLRDHESIPRELRRAQPAAWRTRLIKVAAIVTQSTRRVAVWLAGQWPHWDHYAAVSQRALQAAVFRDAQPAAGSQAGLMPSGP